MNNTTVTATEYGVSYDTRHTQTGKNVYLNVYRLESGKVDYAIRNKPFPTIEAARQHALDRGFLKRVVLR